MNARELKHMARLEEWKERVTECRGSGQSVQAWCREQGIRYKTYHYWEKKVLAEAGQRMAAQGKALEEQFVEMPALPEKRDFVETKPTLAAKVRIKGGELEVYAGADEAMLETLLRVLKNAE